VSLYVYLLSLLRNGSVKIPLSLLGKGSVKTWSQRRIHATVEELLNPSFYMRSLSYQGKQEISSSQSFFYFKRSMPSTSLICFYEMERSHGSKENLVYNSAIWCALNPGRGQHVVITVPVVFTAAVCSCCCLHLCGSS
jgi:hypothetical protein